MIATVSKEACVGCALCASTCPDVFEMQDLIAVVIMTPVKPEYAASAKRAADDCPVSAITVEG